MTNDFTLPVSCRRCLGALLFVSLALPAAAFDVVRDSRPVATLVVRASEGAATGKSKRRVESADQRAANVLVEWVKKMTGAELPVAESAPAGSPAILVGAAAVAAGLSLDEIDSPSREGVGVVCDGRRVLLAGQGDTATIKAACRLLEHWGCRYYMDQPLGEVYPTCQSLSLDELDLREKPGFWYRSIWGSQWSGDTVWKIWNGHGGVPLNTGHAWGNYVSRDLFGQHPEYFRQRDGQREPSDWYCTSNSELRRVAQRRGDPQVETGSGRWQRDLAAAGNLVVAVVLVRKQALVAAVGLLVQQIQVAVLLRLDRHLHQLALFVSRVGPVHAHPDQERGLRILSGRFDVHAAGRPGGRSGRQFLPGQRLDDLSPSRRRQDKKDAQHDGKIRGFHGSTPVAVRGRSLAVVSENQRSQFFGRRFWER